MTSEEQKAVKQAAAMWKGTQSMLDREYDERLRVSSVIMANLECDPNNRQPIPRRSYNEGDVQRRTERTDKALSPILAGFSEEQFREYMRLTIT